MPTETGRASGSSQKRAQFVFRHWGREPIAIAHRRPIAEMAKRKDPAVMSKDICKAQPTPADQALLRAAIVDLLAVGLGTL